MLDVRRELLLSENKRETKDKAKGYYKLWIVCSATVLRKKHIYENFI